MGRLALALVLTALTAAAQSTPDLQSRAQQTSPKSKIVVPAGISVPLALTEPVLARSAKAGESVYAETAFPVVVNNQMAIPPGTYVQGQIDTLTRPGWLSPHAQFQIHFTKIIFTTGYTVELSDLREHQRRGAKWCAGVYGDRHAAASRGRCSCRSGHALCCGQLGKRCPSRQRVAD